MNKKHRKDRNDNRQGRPKKWTDEIVNDLCDKIEKWLEDPKNFYLYDCYYELDLRRNQVDHLRREFPRFASLYLKGKEKEENVMFKVGLNERNAQFLKWAICTHHNYRMDPDGQQSLQDALKDALKDVVKTMDFSKDDESSKA